MRTNDGSHDIRITYTDGADILPVFSNDGKYLMWTSESTSPGSYDANLCGKVSSALWVGRVGGTALTGLMLLSQKRHAVGEYAHPALGAP